jgi:leader peptidase (prepilin peptidase)/N-methyltransferase
MIYFLFGCALIVITFVDIDFQVIPDIISLGGIPVGLFLVYWLPVSYKDAIIGIVLGAGIPIAVIYTYLFLTKKQAMGGGDVKLLGMIGVFIGWKGVLFTLFTASVIGSVVGITWLVITHKNSQSPIPFGPFLSIGAIAYLFWGSIVLDWYMRFMGFPVL